MGSRKSQKIVIVGLFVNKLEVATREVASLVPKRGGCPTTEYLLVTELGARSLNYFASFSYTSTTISKFLYQCVVCSFSTVILPKKQIHKGASVITRTYYRSAFRTC